MKGWGVRDDVRVKSPPPAKLRQRDARKVPLAPEAARNCSKQVWQGSCNARKQPFPAHQFLSVALGGYLWTSPCFLHKKGGNPCPAAREACSPAISVLVISSLHLHFSHALPAQRFHLPAVCEEVSQCALYSFVLVHSR